MEKFDNLLHSSHFREVHRILIASNVPTQDKVLRIFKNQNPINPNAQGIELDLPMIGQQVHGKLTNSN